MAFVNYNNKEITVKIVYYGPALSGKTTCLKYIYSSKEFAKKGKLITLDTDGDRTLFFDFLPIEIGKLGDYSIKIQLYTVPGQVAYDTTRKLVLQGADGVVFIADSQVLMQEQNKESLKNLKDNLESNGISSHEVPIIYQYNKRDLKEILPIDILNKELNPNNKSFFPTIATNGENILEGLHSIMKMVFIYLKNRLSIFQKDKTVMFTAEEITDSLPKADKSKTPEKANAQADKPKPAASEKPKPAAPKEKSLSEATKKEKISAKEKKEDIFELAMPVEDTDTDEKDETTQQDENIFNLDDDNILGSSKNEFNVPEVLLDDEIALDKERSSDVTRIPPEKSDAMKKNNKTPTHIDEVMTLEEPEPKSGQKGFDFPIHIEIPADKDEVNINLSVKIILKRKKE